MSMDTPTRRWPKCQPLTWKFILISVPLIVRLSTPLFMFLPHNSVIVSFIMVLFHFQEQNMGEDLFRRPSILAKEQNLNIAMHCSDSRNANSVHFSFKSVFKSAQAEL